MPCDIFQSRRGYYEFCKWWNRNESEELEDNIYVTKKAPSGTFYAREINQDSSQSGAINGMIMFQRSSVTIKSPDDLSGIKPNSIVEYQGDIWRVSDIGKQKVRIQYSEYLKDTEVSHYWILNLRK